MDGVGDPGRLLARRVSARVPAGIPDRRAGWEAFDECQVDEALQLEGVMGTHAATLKRIEKTMQDFHWMTQLPAFTVRRVNRGEVGDGFIQKSLRGNITGPRDCVLIYGQDAKGVVGVVVNVASARAPGGVWGAILQGSEELRKRWHLRGRKTSDRTKPLDITGSELLGTAKERYARTGENPWIIAERRKNGDQL